MPTYDYKCKACGHTFEIFQSMTESPKRKCPNCGKNALERLIGTGAAVLFKGSGFYQTDYRSESYKKAAEADKPADSKTESKDAKTASTTEAKAAPEKKTESKPATPAPAPKEKKSKAKT